MSDPTKEGTDLFEANIKKIRDIEYKSREVESKNRQLKSILADLFETASTAVTVLRVIIYATSVLGSWFYLQDKTLAVGIASSLTVAHLLIVLKEYLKDKKRAVVDLN